MHEIVFFNRQEEQKKTLPQPNPSSHVEAVKHEPSNYHLGTKQEIYLIY